MSAAEGNTTEFRTALGAFATGVTVVTTLDDTGQPVGVTASSFNSVSLDPRLVLWSLAKKSLSRQAFCSSGHFAIHVLAETQEELSNRFARSGADKFGETLWARGALGSPLLAEYAAVFQCKTRHLYEGGDHLILVGEVVAFETRDHAPLLFHSGGYAVSRARHPPTSGRETVDLEHASFAEDFLVYLVARAYFQISRPTRRRARDLGLDELEYHILVGLSMQSPASLQDIQTLLEHTGDAPSGDWLQSMVDRDLIAPISTGYGLGGAGRDKLIEVLAVGKAFEADIVGQMTQDELVETKRLLRHLIKLSGDDVPIILRDHDR
ncbi:MAG TPA: flavin reductase family protein [Novosphingobium sp.]|nr:flavin reductase family protein [Novosphingobium sp.]